MKSSTVSELKKELKTRSQAELLEVCLRLSKHKKENKELLTYLLFEADNEDAYIENIKKEIDLQFSEINITSYYFIKKSVRKILSNTKKHIRYSKKTETEVALLLHFCWKLKTLRPSYKNNTVLTNSFNRQIEMVKKKITALHEDLQYDYAVELENLMK